MSLRNRKLSDDELEGLDISNILPPGTMREAARGVGRLVKKNLEDEDNDPSPGDQIPSVYVRAKKSCFRKPDPQPPSVVDRSHDFFEPEPPSATHTKALRPEDSDDDDHYPPPAPQHRSKQHRLTTTSPDADDTSQAPRARYVIPRKNLYVEPKRDGDDYTSPPQSHLIPSELLTGRHATNQSHNAMGDILNDLSSIPLPHTHTNTHRMHRRLQQHGSFNEKSSMADNMRRGSDMMPAQELTPAILWPEADDKPIAPTIRWPDPSDGTSARHTLPRYTRNGQTHTWVPTHPSGVKPWMVACHPNPPHIYPPIPSQPTPTAAP